MCIPGPRFLDLDWTKGSVEICFEAQSTVRCPIFEQLDSDGGLLFLISTYLANPNSQNCPQLGAVQKWRHFFRGRGVSQKVTKSDRGEGGVSPKVTILNKSEYITLHTKVVEGEGGGSRPLSKNHLGVSETSHCDMSYCVQCASISPVRWHFSTK